MPEKLLPVCRPARPVSVLAINGTADPIVPFGGGEVRLFRFGRSRGTVASTSQTLRFWAKQDGCTTAPVDPTRAAAFVQRARAAK